MVWVWHLEYDDGMTFDQEWSFWRRRPQQELSSEVLPRRREESINARSGPYQPSSMNKKLSWSRCRKVLPDSPLPQEKPIFRLLVRSSSSFWRWIPNEYLQTFLIAAPQYTDFGLFTEWGSGLTSPARWSWSWWYCKPLIGQWPKSSDWPWTCCAKAGPSSPPVHLSWIMNGVKIQPGSPLVTNMVPVYPLPDNRAISRSSIGVILTEESATRYLCRNCTLESRSSFPTILKHFFLGVAGTKPPSYPWGSPLKLLNCSQTILE